MKCKVIAVVVLCLLVAGCSLNTSKDRLVVGGSVWEQETTQVLFLYFTKAKGVRKLTPLSELYVGQLDSRPDPNAIESLQPGINTLMNLFGN